MWTEYPKHVMTMLVMTMMVVQKLQRDSLPDTLPDSLPDSLSASPGLTQWILNAWTSVGSHKAPLARRCKRLYANPGVVCCRDACGSFHCWCHNPYSSVTTWPNAMLHIQLAQWRCETNLIWYAALSKTLCMASISTQCYRHTVHEFLVMA